MPCHATPCHAVLHEVHTLHEPRSPAWQGRISTAKRSRAISTSEGVEPFKPKDSAVTRADEDKLAMNKLRLEEGRMELWASPGAEDTENGSRVLFPTFPRRWQDAAPGHQGCGLYNPRSPQPTDLLSPAMSPSPPILLLWGWGLPAGHRTLASQLHRYA